MSEKPSINIDRLREIIKEEIAEKKKREKALSEGLDHKAISNVVSVASKLLAAVETFKEKAGPSATSAVTPHLGSLEKVLEDMMNTPASYVAKPKPELKRVSLRAVPGETK